MRLTYVLLCMFLTLNFILAQGNGNNGIQVLYENAEFLKLNQLDIQELRINSAHSAKGFQYIYLQQQANGLDIENAIMSLVIGNQGEIVSAQHSFVKDIKSKVVRSQPANISFRKAVDLSSNHLGIKEHLSSRLDNHVRTKKNKNKSFFSPGILSKSEIPVERIYIRLEDELIAVYKVEIYSKDSNHYWDIYLDDQNGKVVLKQDRIIKCKFGYSSIDDSPDERQGCIEDHNQADLESNVRNLNRLQGNESYNVYPIYTENPGTDDRELIINPAEFNSSPFGWHDVDGVDGIEYMDTRGNNTFVQEDFNFNDAGGKRANGGEDLNFDFNVNFLDGPKSYLDASLTNLFYWVNINHDVFYQYGFDELSGNFQVNNYDRGGDEQDQVFADSQDGSGQNNAQFLTLPDGLPARMEMFIWGNARAILTIPGGSSVAGNWSGPESGFQGGLNKLTRQGAKTGKLVIVKDFAEGTSEACSTNPINNKEALNGAIVIINRGTCTFSEKVLNAQNEGAIACVVCNNVAGTFTMGGSNNNVSIPAMMLSRGDCDKIKRAIIQGAEIEATMDKSGEADNLDSSFDNMIITHEYGHGISNRLTGGRNTTSCLNNSEQMGEGWSDYFGLMLTTDWAVAKAEDRRPVGNWLLKQDGNGSGIRPFPYSYSKSINPMSYGDIKRFSIPHGVGAVWCSMLWDMTWEIINQEEKISNDIYYGNGGNNIALEIVIQGLKLQNCNPGFIDGRDAILLADKMLYDGIHHFAIWKAFARRGLGSRADQVSSFSASDGRSSNMLPESFRSKAELFNASDSISSIILTWNSVREIDNKAFRILRSEDNRLFKIIQELPGLKFSTSPRTLRYEDKDVISGKWYYYKLESQNESFRTEVHGIDSAIIVKTNNLTLFPNPSSGKMNIVISDQINNKVTFEVFNIQGQILKRFNFFDPTILHRTYQLDLTSLAKGTYIMRMQSGDDIHTRKILIK